MREILIALLVIYRQFMSPYVGGGCRFRPSCSEYALESVRRFGGLMGLRLTVGRLRRCQPSHPCGYDPVPTPDQIEASLRGQMVVGTDADG